MSISTRSDEGPVGVAITARAFGNERNALSAAASHEVHRVGELVAGGLPSKELDRALGIEKLEDDRKVVLQELVVEDGGAPSAALEAWRALRDEKKRGGLELGREFREGDVTAKRRILGRVATDVVLRDHVPTIWFKAPFVLGTSEESSRRHPSESLRDNGLSRSR